MFADPLTQRLVDFVTGIGIEVRLDTLGDDTFLPGLAIRDGTLVIDPERLAYPGDILHEAGHIAVADPAVRYAPTLTPSDAEELTTLAWSYAAAVHLELDPAVVFHPDGYKGGSQALIRTFTEGPFIGAPLLQL